MTGRFLFFAALVLALPAAGAAESPWDALRAGGYTVLIRHASTVAGTGDPPGFKLGNCTTQRNLSDAGREEARRIGARFRDENVPVAEVFSSRWCRCLDTARLAFDKAVPTAFLNSFFADPRRREAQMAELAAKIAAFRGPGNLVMVTHQVNMTALTGAYPSQGEAFVVKADPAGRIELKFRITPQ